ncbi:hypothetical protein [Nocardiopsis sp. LOL_012]|uniref:hypothetical protein n=1 Tax=Nocardiopsis sp. LOL_012 TaxID=3345409 RepID=UPI003A86CF66
MTHNREEVTHMPNGELHSYAVKVNGFDTKLQLTEAEARRRGLIPTDNDKPTSRRTRTTTKKKEGDT